MENMKIYEAARNVPATALRQIVVGRLKGKSDINPMYRIKTLTELFGPVGLGWYYDIDKMWLENGASGEVSAFIQISLYVKYDGEWSKPIIGIGGNAFIANEKNGLYTSDECYKMALTDALSVAGKALGIGANVYWGADRTKYGSNEQDPQHPLPSPEAPKITPEQAEKIRGFYGDKLANMLSIKKLNALEDMSEFEAADIIKRCEKKLAEQQQSKAS